MEPFKSFFKPKHQAQLSNKGSTPRHRKPIPAANTADRKHVNMVPQNRKNDNSYNQKIETLKTKPGKFFCDNNDLSYIQKTFLKGRQPNPNEFKMLGGKMGIKFYRDPKHNKWVIEKI